ncbi:MAG TPA: acetyl-coenzyme A synthetase, partial [Acidimicrobiales bacterium]|nr:acetyl-coenzyme A synthetase [Acidimicrobiales bacterium]
VPGVRDVAVTGVADDEWGERVVCVVVTDDEPPVEAIRAAAEEHLGPWAKPKEVRRVAAIPRTPTGKVVRADLAHLF